MFCKKCSYILSGSESYCPSCGTPCEKVFGENEAESPASIFGTPQNETAKGKEIFEDSTTYVKEKEGRKKSKSGVAFVSVLILVVFLAAAIVAADYLNISPAISTIFEKVQSAAEGENTTTSAEYDFSSGTVTPTVVYETTPAYNTRKDGQVLRKGPDETYAEIQTVPFNTPVHILGAADSQALWVYVYVPEEDVYGWLMSSYLSDEKKETEFDETSKEETTAKEEEETEKITTTESEVKETEKETTEEKEETRQPTTKSSSELSVTETEKYTASVTAEQGVYMREGPSTDYKAVNVLGQGEKVTVMGCDSENKNWLYIEYGDIKGYVNGA